MVEVRWSIGNGWFRWPPAVPWPVLLWPHPCLTLRPFCVFFGMVAPVGPAEGEDAFGLTLLEILISAGEPHDKEDAF